VVGEFLPKNFGWLLTGCESAVAFETKAAQLGFVE
jgi:hypothetical protein